MILECKLNFKKHIKNQFKFKRCNGTSLEFVCASAVEYCSPLLLGIVDVEANKMENTNYYYYYLLIFVLNYSKSVS